MKNLIARIADLIADYHGVMAVSTPTLSTVVCSNAIIQQIDGLTTQLETRTGKEYRSCIRRLLFT